MSGGAASLVKKGELCVNERVCTVQFPSSG
jgi:hypothetical protein